MITKIIGLVIGIILLIAGLYYMSTAKDDPEGKKIYGITAAIGLIIAVVCAVLLFL